MPWEHVGARYESGLDVRDPTREFRYESDVPATRTPRPFPQTTPGPTSGSDEVREESLGSPEVPQTGTAVTEVEVRPRPVSVRE